MQPYDYQNRHGVETISWERFESLTRTLALQVASFGPELVLGIARGGLFPATLLSTLLRRELYPIRLTRRVEDQVVSQSPIWLVRPPEKVRGRRVLLVDEIADSGQTLAMAAEEVRAMGAADVRSATLYAHSWAHPRPSYVALVSDALIINPWDQEILHDGRFIQHPEIAQAIAAQRKKPSSTKQQPPEGETKA